MCVWLGCVRPRMLLCASSYALVCVLVCFHAPLTAAHRPPASAHPGHHTHTHTLLPSPSPQVEVDGGHVAGPPAEVDQAGVLHDVSHNLGLVHRHLGRHAPAPAARGSGWLGSGQAPFRPPPPPQQCAAGTSCTPHLHTACPTPTQPPSQPPPPPQRCAAGTPCAPHPHTTHLRAATSSGSTVPLSSGCVGAIPPIRANSSRYVWSSEVKHQGAGEAWLLALGVGAQGWAYIEFISFMGECASAVVAASHKQAGAHLRRPQPHSSNLSPTCFNLLVRLPPVHCPSLPGA